MSDTSVGAPVAGAVVSVIDSAGSMAGRTITDVAGRFSLSLPARAARLRVIRIGYQPRDVVLVGPLGAPIRIAMTRLPTTLTTMRVSGRELCPGSDDRGPAFQLWEQARAGLLAAVVARESNPAHVTTMTFRRVFDPGNDLVRHVETKSVAGTTTRPFIASAPAAEFARRGYMTEDPGGRTFFAPDADVLLDESFVASHCFRLAADDAAHQGQIGLAFAPAPGPGRDTLVDVRGVIWIDRATPALRSLDFVYTALERPAMDRNAGGHIEFRTVSNGISFIEQWALRLVNMEVFRSTTAAPTNVFTGRRREDRTDVRAVQIDETGGLVLAAKWPDGASWRAPETGIAGHVVQAGSSTPAEHALVTLTAGVDTVATDATGAFSLTPMIAGRYEVVATDTTISAHMAPRRVVQIVDVARDRVVDIQLNVRPLTDLLTDLCKDGRQARSTTAIIGRVAIGGVAPPDAIVSAMWQADYKNVARADRDGRREDKLPLAVVNAAQKASVDNAGRFIVCGVAVDRPIQLSLSVRDTRLADTIFYARKEPFSSMEWQISPHEKSP